MANWRVNWTAVAIGFAVAVVLELVGALFFTIDLSVSTFIGILAPIVGGLIASFTAGGVYRDGMVNGGLAGGMGSFIATFIVLSGASLVPIVASAIISGIIGVILGLIGGLIGILAKRKPEEEPKEES